VLHFFTAVAVHSCMSSFFARPWQSTGETRADADVCAVCLGPCEDPCFTPCGHTYCRRCIVRVLDMRAPSWLGSCPLCLRKISLYSIRDASGVPLAEASVTSLYGGVYVQVGGLGIASYHFDNERDCYISYERAPPQWKLDDGSAPPSKVPFEAASFEPETRTFRGTVNWTPSFDGDLEWKFSIVFAEDFCCIVDGNIEAVKLSGVRDDSHYVAPWERESPRSLTYWQWKPPPTSLFNSVFVQGQHYAWNLEGIASYHFNSEEDSHISYSSAPPQWVLGDGSAPPRKKRFRDVSYDNTARIFKGTVDWEVPFDGYVRWEYEIHFDEEFSKIVGGRIHLFSASGGHMERRFMDPSIGPNRPLMYVRKPDALMTPQMRDNRAFLHDESDEAEQE